jgi:hypothetical protein
VATTLSIESLPLRAPQPPSEGVAARTAIYGQLGEPPNVLWHTDSDPGRVIQSLCDVACEHSAVPPLAIREVVENLMHANMDGALVSVLDGGSTVRVCDSGPGITCSERAVQPGFTTAGPEQLGVIRGVGAGLATARALLAAQEGSLDISDNLGCGAAVTLTVPVTAPYMEPPLPEASRSLMALLLELDDAPLDRLASELGSTVAACGRTLIELEQMGLVSRGPKASRTLTDEGRNMITALFS